ncbi:hypothetical protein FZI44_16895 [Cronobacter sakazakii]|nr:hypothetical protein FZI15_00345 [Cronobacter sakazakii]KAB0821790.1 hypothetical protein FZI44_16895 [Cronobacter sakazakii]
MLVNLTVEVKPRWWLSVYLRTLLFFCVITGLEPDYHKLRALIIKHGISQKLKAVPTEEKTK